MSTKHVKTQAQITCELRFNLIKGKTKIELPKTTNAEKMTLDDALALVAKKSPKKKKAAPKKKTVAKKKAPAKKK